MSRRKPKPLRILFMERVERALALHVEVRGKGVYLVSGGAEPHWVNLGNPRAPPCDCGSHLWGERVCKHMMAAQLVAGVPMRMMVRDAWAVERSAASRRLAPDAGVGHGAGSKSG